MELHQQPQMFYPAEVNIGSLKTLKHQCRDVVSSRVWGFEDELQQPEKWKSVKEREESRTPASFPNC